jgi:hypothetical protein
VTQRSYVQGIGCLQPEGGSPLRKYPKGPDEPDDLSRTYAFQSLSHSQDASCATGRRVSIDRPQDLCDLRVLAHVLPKQVVMPGVHPADLLVPAEA